MKRKRVNKRRFGCFACVLMKPLNPFLPKPHANVRRRWLVAMPDTLTHSMARLFCFSWVPILNRTDYSISMFWIFSSQSHSRDLVISFLSRSLLTVWLSGTNWIFKVAFLFLVFSPYIGAYMLHILSTKLIKLWVNYHDEESFAKTIR